MKTNKEHVIRSVGAGISIGIGGAAYLITGYAWVFPIGLLMVCLFEQSLFTGKICTIYRIKFASAYAVCYILNTVAAYLFGLLIRWAKPEVIDKAVYFTEKKLASGISVIPLAFLCNILIYYAIKSYKSVLDNGVITLWFATTLFVMCGFEHCIANAFYFGVSATFSLKAVLYLLINAIFNGLGGIFAHRFLDRRFNKL